MNRMLKRFNQKRHEKWLLKNGRSVSLEALEKRVRRSLGKEGIHFHKIKLGEFIIDGLYCYDIVYLGFLIRYTIDYSDGLKAFLTARGLARFFRDNNLMAQDEYLAGKFDEEDIAA